MELHLTMTLAIAKLNSLFKQWISTSSFSADPPEQSLNPIQFAQTTQSYGWILKDTLKESECRCILTILNRIKYP